MAAYLSNKGFKVLVIDFDSQHNLSTGYKIPEDFPYTVFDLLNGEGELQLSHKKENMWILAGSDQIDTKIFEIDLLKNRLEQLEKHFREYEEIPFDFVLIDCSPSDLKNKYNDKGKLVPKLNQIALYASNSFLVPLVHEEYAVKGLEKFMNDAGNFKEEHNLSYQVAGVFFNKVEVNTKNFKEYYKYLREEIPEEWFIETFIRKDSKIGVAVATGKDIWEIDSDCRAAEGFTNLCEEVLTNIN
jgi:chromosome partitioning protein